MVEPWYGTAYSVERISESTVQVLFGFLSDAFLAKFEVVIF